MAPFGDHLQLHRDIDGRLICSARYFGQVYLLDGGDRKVSNYMRKQLFDLYAPGESSLDVMLPRIQSVRMKYKYTDFFAIAFAIAFGFNGNNIEKMTFDACRFDATMKEILTRRSVIPFPKKDEKRSSETTFKSRLFIRLFNIGTFRHTYLRRLLRNVHGSPNSE